MHPRDFDAGLDADSMARFAALVGLGEVVTFETLSPAQERDRVSG